MDSDIKEVAMERLQQTNESLEQQEKQFFPVETKMRQMGSKIKGLRDKHRARPGPIEKLRSRDDALQKTSRDMHFFCEKLKKRFKAMHKTMQVFQDEIARLENTNEGRRAIDAGSVQNNNANTSCCGGAAPRMQTVFEDLWNRKTQVPPDVFRSELGYLQAWLARFSAEMTMTLSKVPHPSNEGLALQARVKGS